MDSARKIMEKYGWKEGEGLGQNKNGIVNPLKASMKFDSTGLGLDKASEFTNQWWDRVYIDAATNIDVQNDGNTTVIAVKDEHSVEISTKEYSIKKLQEQKHNDSYGNFIKHSTLTSQGSEIENVDKIDIDEIKFTQNKVLTDEELFAACGNRTAHKGARHGLYMSGKLARIAQQDAELLSKMNTDSKEKGDENKMDIDTSDPADWITIKSKKKKKSKTDKHKKKNTNNNDEESDKVEGSLFKADYCIKSCKKRKRKSKVERELSTSLSAIFVNTEPTQDQESVVKPAKSKKTKKSVRDKELDNIVVTKLDVNEDTGFDENIVMPHKKKKSKHNCKSIHKSKKEERKKAKKLQKNIDKLTMNLQKSIIQSVDE